ncbi:MAG: polysaccharide export protein [Desulfobacter sp.]|nr:MAG: polysaccharide export protein [Desulfobacter sp.]
MSVKRMLLAVVCMVFLTGVPAAFGEPYKIGAGDILDISVWKNPDLTRQVIVLPDDTIRFPLIGEIKVGEQTLAWLEENLRARLEKYVPDPVLSVAVTQTGSLSVYVIGKVNKPGRFQINNNVDVLQALAIAGGLNPFAREKEIKVFRKKGEETLIFDFNYDAVSEGEHLEQNIMLRRGDVIVVR